MTDALQSVITLMAAAGGVLLVGLIVALILAPPDRQRRVSDEAEARLFLYATETRDVRGLPKGRA